MSVIGGFYLDTGQGIKLTGGRNKEQLEDVLAGKYAFREEEPVFANWKFYDTFDWRLFNKSLTLHLSGQELCLRSLSNGECLDGTLTTSWSGFARNLPESSFKNRLQSITEPRALLLLCEVNTRSSTYRIFNKQEKTVARIVYAEVYAATEGSPRPQAAYINLLPVRGYPRHAKQLGLLLEQVGLPSSQWEDIYFNALQKVGLKPGSYSAKLGVKLDPHMRSDEAAKVILRRLLKIMRSNEAGIKGDVDSEFLHDHRIAIRKTRSALSQIRDVFPEETTNRFKQDFAYLGEISNELRDLDVYLLSESKYCSMLPDAMHDDIRPLFNYLKTKRIHALHEVIVGLESEQYTGILRDWGKFLNEPVSATDTAANAEIPVIDLARKQIYKRYRRVVKDGGEILNNTQDELLHALRIECKKLRYLLEIFATLFPRKKISRLIKQLKNLQDNLGDFNDLSIQQEYLLRVAEEIPLDDTQSRKALVATGYLVDNLAHRQRVVKANFARVFIDFASPANQKHYHELFVENE